MEGRLHGVITLIGELSGAATLQGTLSAPDTLEGTLSAMASLSGDLIIPDTIGGRHYDGEYIVTPRTDSAIVLSTNGLVMDDDVTVKKIPYYETSNESGYTAYIGNEV